MHDPPGHPAATGPPDPTAGPRTSPGQRHRPSVEHFIAVEAAAHLDHAARLLSQAPGRDAIILCAPKAAAVLSTLRNAAPYGGILPSFDLLNAIQGLHTWPLHLRNQSPERPRLHPYRNCDEQAS